VSGVLLRRQMGTALLTFLNTNTPFKWGDGDMPDEPGVAYGIVYSMNTETKWPDLEFELERIGCHYFQLTNVGTTREQVALISAQACKVLTDKDASGYVHPLNVSGGTVIKRELNNLGSINKQSERIYSSADSYEILVEG